MKAVVYKGFGVRPEVREVPDPFPSEEGVVLKVGACGVCRSDWHGWQGNDPDIVLPHVPGHELAGTIVETGINVSKFRVGDRVTVPFIAGCGRCSECESGNQQICDHQFQPGFTAWGGFAEYVALEYADGNLVTLPAEMDFVTASSLGCRFVTSFRAVVDQGKVRENDRVAVFGCGGVGLSAIMIAKAYGAKVAAVDIDDAKLEFARAIGADWLINGSEVDEVSAVLDFTEGGASISIDAIGSPSVMYKSVSVLRKRGRHVQIGLMEADEHDVKVPANLIIAKELEILGSHGMQAHRYGEMLGLIEKGVLEPDRLVGRKLSLEESVDALVSMDEFKEIGVSVIDNTFRRDEK